MKTEKLNYVSNTQSSKPSISFEKVRIAKKSARIGAQHLSLKQILKEKIDQKRKEEWIKKEEQKKIDNEEEDSLISAIANGDGNPLGICGNCADQGRAIHYEVNKDKNSRFTNI